MAAPTLSEHRRRSTFASSKVPLERARLKALEVGRVDEELRRGGVNSSTAVANELNARGITAPRGGLWTGAQVDQQLRYHPAGYTRPKGVGNEAQQKVRRVIVELRAGGVSLRSIAAQLNERGMTAPRGGLWTKATIRQTLQSKSVSRMTAAAH
jgi:recombinase